MIDSHTHLDSCKPSDADLDRALASLVEGLRVVAAFLLPYLPERMGVLLDALGVEDRGLRGLAEGPRVERVASLDPLFPKRDTGA